MTKQSHRQFKDAIYTQLSRIGKGVSSPRRLELLDLLRQGPRTVEELAQETGQTMAATSHHLRELHAHRLVDAEKNGLYVTYRLADDKVSNFFAALRALAEGQLADIQNVTKQFLREQHDTEPLDRDALLKRLKSGNLVLLDVRPRKEYDAGHLPGAISIPISELKRKLKDLPRNREIVAYCRGPYCVMASEAVELLRAKGFRAIRFDLGVPDWKELGLPVEYPEARP